MERGLSGRSPRLLERGVNYPSPGLGVEVWILANCYSTFTRLSRFGLGPLQAPSEKTHREVGLFVCGDGNRKVQYGTQ